MKREFEMQGPDVIPEREDRIFMPNESGELVELNIPDDEEGDE